MNTKEYIFILKARKVHGDKYDYSKVVYVKAIEKVIIICPEHGEFKQIANGHLSGQGCPKCSGKFKPTTEEYIQKAKKIHGNKYKYSKVVYVDAKSKVIITCSKHGDFLQTPDSHLRGHGCSKCGDDKLSDLYRLSTKIFIDKASKLHNNYYTYPNVKYVKNNVKVIITCSKHGDFLQTPSKHLIGRGCSKCNGEKQSILQRKTTEKFIEEARLIHGKRYDYSKLNYTGAHNKVIIICSIHGEFKQIAQGHLKGYNCPKCSGKYMDTKLYLELVNKLHNNYYTYPNFIYTHSKDKINIVCPKHGEFQIVGSNHLQGAGCLKCALKSNRYLPHDEMVTFIRNLNLKSQKEYFKWWKENKPDFLPKRLDYYYENLK